MGSTSSPQVHVPVLLNESITGLAIQKGDVVIDGTFGGGGHSGAIEKQYGTQVQLVCVDLDENAQARFEASALSKKTNVTFVHANFKDVALILEKAAVDTVSKVLLDLGTSTFQLLQDRRGFSFQSDTPLRMSFSEAGSHTGFSAHDIVNTWEENSIADIIFYYGEERHSRKIAKAICVAREEKEIKTSGELAKVIETAIPRYGRINPATKTFQALRIAVNDELQVIKEALDAWEKALAPNGRIAVITFHSLEDRIVKQWMNTHKESGVVLTKKPIVPGKEELQTNSKARSAKLRIYEKN